MATGEKSVMVVAIDDSEHNFYALEWTLDHFFTPSPTNSPFKLIIVHARPTAPSVIGAAAGPGVAGVIPIVEFDLKTFAARVVEKAKEICVAKSVNDACFEVHEGDARNVLCEPVESVGQTEVCLQNLERMTELGFVLFAQLEKKTTRSTKI